MKVTAVKDFFYRKHDSRVAFNKRELEYYINQGYKLVEDRCYDGHYRVTKPVEVWLQVVGEDGKEYAIECKDEIVAFYDMTKISKKAAEMFVAEAQHGLIDLEIDYWGKFVVFPR